jgi:hypothetical protein
MPLRRLAEESRSFDPNAVSILLTAYGGVVSDLGLKDAAEKKRAARLIIRLAQGRTDLDAGKPRNDAKKALSQ